MKTKKTIVLDEKEIEILAKFADFLEHFVDEAVEPSRVCKLCPLRTGCKFGEAACMSAMGMAKTLGSYFGVNVEVEEKK